MHIKENLPRIHKKDTSLIGRQCGRFFALSFIYCFHQTLVKDFICSNTFSSEYKTALTLKVAASCIFSQPFSVCVVYVRPRVILCGI